MLCYASAEMEYRDKRNMWLRLVDMKRRDVVFPPASKNDVEWLQYDRKRPLPLMVRIFYTSCGALGLGLVLVEVYRLYREGSLRDVAATLALIAVFFLGPIFGLLTWSAHRSLRQIRDLKRSHRVGRRS